MKIIILLGLCLSLSSQDLIKNLKSITAFHFISENLASSGHIKLDDYQYIKEYGFKHVINLLPGNQIKEKAKVKSLGMTYSQIPVIWAKPTMENLEVFVDKMNELKGQKVYIHCAANMRASAFIFVYRVSQLSVDKKVARADMDTIWYPANQWYKFISDGLKKYNIDPEYRFESDFVKYIRKNGVKAGIEFHKKQNDILFKERDLTRLARDFSYKKDPDNDLYLIYQFITDTYPQSAESFLQRADYAEKVKKNKDAINSYKKLLNLKPGHTWSKRMLGKLGDKNYLKYWTGNDKNLKKLSERTGRYKFNSFNLDIMKKEKNYYLLSSWDKKEYLLKADSEKNFFIRERNWQFTFKDKKITVVFANGHTMTGEKIK